MQESQDRSKAESPDVGQAGLARPRRRRSPNRDKKIWGIVYAGDSDVPIYMEYFGPPEIGAKAVFTPLPEFAMNRAREIAAAIEEDEARTGRRHARYKNVLFQAFLREADEVWAKLGQHSDNETAG